MPPRTTRKSYRPRVSDRTMVGIYDHAACPRQKPKASSPQEMHRSGKKTRRASQHNLGWAVQRIDSLLSVAGGVFLLTFPFIERRYRKHEQCAQTKSAFNFTPDFAALIAAFQFAADSISPWL